MTEHQQRIAALRAYCTELAEGLGATQNYTHRTSAEVMVLTAKTVCGYVDDPRKAFQEIIKKLRVYETAGEWRLTKSLAFILGPTQVPYVLHLWKDK